MKKTFLKVMAAVAVIAIIGVSCTKDDITNPTITLNGDATMYLDLGDNFTDPGAVANDDKDGDLSTQITTTGTVNTDKVGEYVITYTVSDKAGNTTKEKRTVLVKSDKLAGGYSVSSTVTGSGSGTYNYTEDITASSTTYNKIMIANFSGFANLNVPAYVEGQDIKINETITYDFNGDGTATNATVTTLGSSYEVDKTGGMPVAKVLTINYKIDYGSGSVDNVEATYVKN